jgi:ABC-type oligopeptide transport system ATPase subunit
VTQRDLLGRPEDVTIALDGVSLAIEEGETCAVAGESGAGKSTLARIIVGLTVPTSGSVSVLGVDPHVAKGHELRAFRRRVQMVFQDPMQSFNPRRTVESGIGLPLENQGVGRAERKRRVAEMMERVGLHHSQMTRYPHEFSGGQAQRLAIARAMISNPTFVALDEPVSALDVSIQAQILNLLRDLQEERKVTYLLIGNSLSVVEHVARHVAVMRCGQIVEFGTREDIYRSPKHPYTRSLLAAGRPDHLPGVVEQEEPLAAGRQAP